ncbi:MAG: 3'-5' exonuclease, partial [Wenzhouxiangella sp.]
VYGGLRFFERAEIKDAMAYLRLVHNRGDDPAFERVVNVPTRGIGERTVAGIRDHARARGESLFAAATDMVENGRLTARAGNAVAQFLELVNDLDRRTREAGLGETMSAVVETARLGPWYRQREAPDRAETREENLTELVRAAETFAQPIEDEQAGLSPLASFLAQAALEAGEHQSETWQDCVQLMTLHSAKGLEFPLVFLCGLEEGLFPHHRSIEEPGRLAEERRLCYVGMTRAMRRLYISYAESRQLHGQTTMSRPSRFVDELPRELIEMVRPGRPAGPAAAGFSRPDSAQEHGFSLGATVQHARFGTGTVVNLEGQGANARIQVNFEQAGAKWLVVSYANLERLD